MKPTHIIAAIISAAAIAGLHSCDSGIDYPEPKLVVEGTFDSDGFPDVILTLSVVPDDRYTDISEALMRWATVTVSDNDGNTAILTGAPLSALPLLHLRHKRHSGAHLHHTCQI